MKVGEILKTIRKDKKLSQMVVCGKVGVSQTWLSQIESDTKEPSPEMLRKICKYYKVPPQVVVWKSIEEKDIPKDKREIFNQLSPVVNGLIAAFFK
jgi:transcriptional regulator with XRE-family HTH domain